MSSIVRQYVQTKSALTKFTLVDGPSYTSVITRDLSGEPLITRDILFPFTWSNGTLDINLIDDFQEQMIDISGNSPTDECDFMVRQMGGPRVVRAIGNNFKNYIRAWRSSTININSAIDVHIPGVVVKVQMADVNHMGDSSVARVTTEAPTADNFTVGDTSNKYRTTYCFKQPLTLRLRESGVTTYITFRTAFDED
jgi:hypothetical protein